jgi:tetratricopeptide (TPR) repeat protein
MKRLMLCLSLALLLSAQNMPIYAQDNDEPDDEDRFITVSFGTLYDQDTPQLVALIGVLIDEFPVAFAESDITILLERDPEFSAVQVVLDFAQDTVYVDFEAIPPLPTLLPSPYLIPHPFFNFPLSASPENPLWRQLVSQFTMALAQYIQADCEGMLPYVENVEEIATQIEELSYAQETLAYLNFYRANCAVANSDLQTAQALYEDILTFFDDNGYDFRYGLETRINLAWVYYQLGEVDLAYETINRIIGFTGIDWATVSALQLRASFYLLEEDYDSAIADLDEALEIYADDPLLVGEIIAILILADDLKTAEKELNRLRKIEDGYPVILFYEGLLAYAVDDNDTAQDFLSEFLAFGLNDYLSLEARTLLAEIQAR